MMKMYGIFDKPLDQPDKFVIREYFIGPATTDFNGVTLGEAQYANTLEEARKLVPEGLHRLPRMPQDPRFLVETWL